MSVTLLAMVVFLAQYWPWLLGAAFVVTVVEEIIRRWRRRLGEPMDPGLAERRGLPVVEGETYREWIHRKREHAAVPARRRPGLAESFRDGYDKRRS